MVFGALNVNRLIGAARKALKEGRPAEAEQILWEASQQLKGAKNVARLREVFSMLEGLYKKDARETELLDLYRHWLEDDPDNPDVLRSMARIYVKHRDCSPVVKEIYRKTIQFFPDEALILVGLAECLMKEGREDRESLQIVQRAADLDKLWVRGFKHLAKVYSETSGREEREIEVLKRLYVLQALDKAGLQRLARLMARFDDASADAMAVYREALEGNPGLLDVAKSVARRLVAAKKPDPTWLQILEECDRRTGGDPILDVALVRAYMASGRKDYDVIERAKNAARSVDDEAILELAAVNLPGLKDTTKEAFEIYSKYFKKNPAEKTFLRKIVELLSEVESTHPLVHTLFKSAASQGINIPEAGLRRVASALARERDVSSEAQTLFRQAYEKGLRDIVVTELIAASLMDAREVSPFAEPVFKDAFHQTRQEQVKLSVAEGLLRQFANRERLQPADAGFVHFLYERDRLKVKDMTPAECEVLANTYCAEKRQDEKALRVYQAYLETKRGRADKGLRQLVVPFFVARKEDTPFTVELYRRYYEEGGRTPEIITSLLQKELESKQKTNLFQPLLLDALENDLPVKRGVDSAVWHDVAKRAYSQGHYSVALKGIQRALEGDGENSELLYLKAKSLLALGELRPAAQALVHLSDGWEHKRAYWMSVVQLRTGEVEKAGENLNLAYKDKALKPYALVRKAELAEATKQLQKAVEFYRSAGDSKEVGGYAWARIGLLCLREKQYEASVDAFKKALGFGERAAAKGLAQASFHLAMKHIQQKNYGAAASAVSEAIRHDFQNKNLWKSAIEILFRAGLAAMAKQQYKEAARLLNEVLNLNYKFHAARFYLAQSYMHLKDSHKALTEYEELLRTAETAREERVRYFAGLTLFEMGSAQALHQFLSLYQQGGDSDYAGRSLKALVYSVLTLPIDLDGPHVEQLPVEPVRTQFPHWIFASYMLKLKKFEAAIKELKELFSENPNDPKTLYFLGLSYILKGDRTSGLPYWYKILEVNPGKIGDHILLVQTYARLGFFLLEEGYTEKAMEAWERIKAFDPTHRYADYLLAQVYKQMGYILAKRDRLREGIVKWEMARKLYPKDLELLHNLAVGYTILGELKEATRMWRLLQTQWRKEIDKSPDTTVHFQIWYEEVNNFLTAQEEASNPAASALSRANADEYLLFVRRANQFYWFLGLERNATRTHVERRYFKLIKTYSPEKHPEEFILLEEAYQYLTDPKRREQSLLYIFEPVDFKRLAEDMRGNKLSIEDFLFWDRNLLPLDKPIQLADATAEKEFGPLSPASQVYKGMEVAATLDDWAL